MKKRVILHIGFPKTGTTSIQSFGRRFRQTLSDAGVLYPDLFVPEADKRAQASHKALMIALLTDPPARLAASQPASIELTDRLFAAFLKSEQPTLLLSHETLSQRRDIDFERLRSWTQGCQLTILAFVRVFDEWLESLFAQHLRADQAVARPFHQTRLSDLEALRFLPQLRMFKAALPDARWKVMSFDRFRTGGLVEKVLRLARVNDDSLIARAAASQHFNIGRATPDVMFGAYLSLAFRDPGATQAAVIALERAREVGTDAGLVSGSFKFIPREQKAAARELYRRDLPALRTEFGVKIADPGPVTPDQADYASHLSREQFDGLLAAARPYLPPALADCPPDAYDRAVQRFVP